MGFDRGKPTLVKTTKAKALVKAPPKAAPKVTLVPTTRAPVKVLDPQARAPVPVRQDPQRQQAKQVIAQSRSRQVITGGKGYRNIPAKYKASDPVVKTLVKQGYLSVGAPTDRSTWPIVKHSEISAGPKLLSVKQLQKRAMYADIAKQAQQQTISPVAVKALDIVARPAHALMGGLDAVVKGHPEQAQAAAQAGLMGHDHVLAGQVLKDAGVHSKLVQGVVGATADIVLDPTTYVTFGAGTIAAKAAEQAAKDAAKQALKAGATADAAKSLGLAAAKHAAERAAPGKGVTVRFAGREVPGVRRATGAANRLVKKAPGEKVRAGVKDVARDVRPQLTPAGVPEAAHVTVSSAAAETRGQITEALQRARRIASGVEKQIPKDQHAAFIHAIETQNFKALPPELRDHAIYVSAVLKDARRTATEAGVGVGDATKAAKPSKAAAAKVNPNDAEAVWQASGRRNAEKPGQRWQVRVPRPTGQPETGPFVSPKRTPYRDYHFGDNAQAQAFAKTSGGTVSSADRRAATKGNVAKGYFPHGLTDVLEGGGGVAEHAPVKVEGVGVKTIKLGAKKPRTDLRTVKAINAEHPGKFSTDAPLLLANYLASIGTAAAKSRFNRVLADSGRTVKFADEIPLHDGEGLFVIKGSDIHQVKPGEAEIKGGRYVAVNQKLADQHLASLVPSAGRSRSGEIFDKTTGLWKKSKTFSFAFHARNAIGDTHMAYMVPGRSGRRVAVEAGQAGKVLKTARKMDRAEHNLRFPKASGKTVKLAGKRVPAEQIVKRLRASGAVQTGYIGRELADLTGRSGVSPVARLAQLPQGGLSPLSIKRLMADRENLHRAGTAMHGMGKQGLPDRAAGALSRDTHIDYGNLTPFEKGARRAMPFYTFTARGLPIYTKALLKTPGKFAAYEKLIEEAANATGANKQDAYKRLQVFEQQQVPAIIGKNQYSASLPLNLLNDLPDPAHPKESARIMADQAMGLVNPLLKTPLEVMSNHSFFTHRPLQDPKAPLVAAPDWVKRLPKVLQKQLGVTDQYVDKRTGKKELGWNGYAQYGMGQAPALVTQVSNLLTHGTSQRGQNEKQKIAAALTGVKGAPIPPAAVNQLTDLFSKYDRLNARMARLRQTGVNAAAPSAEYTRLLGQSKALRGQITAASAATGDKSPVFSTTGKKLTPFEKKYGVGGGFDKAAFQKKYGVSGGFDAAAFKAKYGVK